MAVVGSATVIIRAITAGFSKDVDKAFKNFAKDAERARARFQSMVRTGYTLAPLASVLISSLGSLGGGILSLGAAAAATIPSLVTLGGVFASLGLAAAVTGAAFSGVGNAISAGLKKSKESAKKDSNAAIAALRRLESAQENLEDANNRLTEAQNDLNRAFKDGREELQQLGFDAEDAAINEKKAAIELEKARDTLARVQDLPPNSRARREAQLAFAEAELNYRKSKDRNKDLQQQQKDLVESSKNVSSELLATAKAAMPDVQDEGMLRLLAATDTVQDAYKATKDAAVAKARAERDAMRAAQDAETDSGGAGAADAFNEALQELSPEAQAFVKFIVNDFTPALKGLRDAAAAGLFPGLEAGLTKLKDEVFPVLTPLFTNLGASVATAFNNIVAAISDVENLEDLKKAFETAGVVVEKFGTIFGNVWDIILSLIVGADAQIRRFVTYLEEKTGEFAKFLDTKQASGELDAFFAKYSDIAASIGGVLGNVVSTIVNIVDAAFKPGGGGYLIIDWLTKVTQGWEDFFSTTAGADWLRDTTTNAISALSSLGAFIEEILKAGADPNVAKFWDTLKTAAPIFGDILREANAAAPALATFIVEIFKFTKLTLESGAITTFFTVLRVALTAVNKVLENDIVAGILKVTGTVFAFLSALGLIGSVIGFAFKVVAGNVLKVIVMFGRLTGITKLANLTLTALRATIFSLAQKAIASLLVGLRALGMFFLTNPVGLFITVLAGLVILFVTLYKKSDSFREAVQSAFEKIKNAVETAFNWIKENWPLLLAIITGPIGLAVLVITKNWDKIVEFVKGAVEKIGNFLSGVWDFLKTGLEAVWNGIKVVWDLIVAGVKLYIETVKKVIGFIWDVLKTGLEAAWNGIKVVWDLIVAGVKLYIETVTKVISFVWDVIKTGISKAWDGAKATWDKIVGFVTEIVNKVKGILGGIWSGLKDGLTAAWEAAKSWWNRNIAGKGFTLGGFKVGPIQIPKVDIRIPSFAEGGVVYPSPGGVIARVAEAGRPERIEPLDSQGLSNRDRAIIAQLSGGGGGTANVINVYPSAGMNESELAAMIDRALAFRLRRGGA